MSSGTQSATNSKSKLNSNLRLELAKDYKTLQICQAENHDTWGVPLSIEDYYERELKSYKDKPCNFERNYDDPSTKEGVYYWVMYNENDEIVCSCETLVCLSYHYQDIGKTGGEGDIGKCYSAIVGSVYTFKAHRGNGYATQMMNSLVEWKLPELLNEQFDFTFLYSEVGEYYSRMGFKSYHVPTIEIPVVMNGKLKVSSDLNEIEMLGTDHTKQIEVYDEQVKKMILAKGKEVAQSGSEQQKLPILAMKPTQEKFNWFYERDKHTGEKLYNVDPESLKFGIALKESPGDNFIAWHLDFRARLVMIIAIQTTSFINLQKLIRAMFTKLQSPDFCHESNSHNPESQHTEQLFDKVVIWEEEIVNFDNGDGDGNVAKNGNSEVLTWLKDEFESAEFNISNESLSALRLLHPEMNNGNLNLVHWISNSKWCWY
ncbi:unnamed protein product [Ambrosiozyma monospora]|uniref:Unnamed protein product n=1 Tax=Ambrosiozyma monospora TaxID=43982 RepID=A0ACB5SYD1_AMBMO|nr:unnamed protein product [Ambrosiozyma monospora]